MTKVLLKALLLSLVLLISFQLEPLNFLKYGAPNRVAIILSFFMLNIFLRKSTSSNFGRNFLEILLTITIAFLFFTIGNFLRVVSFNESLEENIDHLFGVVPAILTGMILYGPWMLILGLLVALILMFVKPK